METETVTRSESYASLARAFSSPEADSPDDLVVAYTRLFLGPGKPIAYPYESVYVEGSLLGEAARQVVSCYADAGLRLEPSERELPDHIAIELAFMAYLAVQEECQPDRVEMWRKRQRRFLHVHLARWLPQFYDKIIESELHSYYTETARVAREFFNEELVRLSPQTRQKRFPNLRLGVDISRCTLCTLCADNCQPGALTVGCTSKTLSLVFDPSSCNGCRACIRICPEEAITIDLSSPLSSPPEAREDVLISASRVICPVCQKPHIAEPWFARLVERLGGGEAARISLALCPFCKVNLEDGSPIMVGLVQESLPNV